jgi:hypothetical protein
MNDLLLHPFRAASALLAVLLAVVGYIFFEAPILMIPASLLALRFLTSPTRSLQIVGVVGLVLIFVSHNVKRLDFKDEISRDLVVNCAFTCSMLPLAHLIVTNRINRSRALMREKEDSQQASTGQSASRPLPELKASDKPQPEAEGRSR